MKRVIVSGSNGFIGRYTLPFLVNAGFEVHALYWHGDGTQVEEVTWHKTDLMNHEAVNMLLHELQPTHLLHLAWYTEHGKFWHAPENLQWVACSLNLLKSFIAQGGQRVLMAGSCAEYDWSDGHCIEQESVCNPATLYGTCKYSLYKIAEAFCVQSKVSFAWGRIFFLYGPGEVSSRFVPEVINGLLRQEKVPCSDGSQVRDFMYVEDVASAFVALLISNLTGVLNIASGEAFTLRKIGETIVSQLGGDELLEYGALPNRPGEQPVLTADVIRLRDELGFWSTYSLEQGLAETIAWWRNGLEKSCDC